MHNEHDYFPGGVNQEIVCKYETEEFGTLNTPWTLPGYNPHDVRLEGSYNLVKWNNLLYGI